MRAPLMCASATAHLLTSDQRQREPTSSSDRDRSWDSRGVDALVGEHLAGRSEGRDAGRDTRVDHDLDQRLAQLAERAAVAQGASEMQTELLHAAERREDREVVQAAL